ncbi:hypothetical protein RB195_011002 [Necator americanus]|uniref:Uncharacterized protein n=1 Tax=Necator americanus TaxID=51031 RepID=A0ABR1D1F3_NECAM
MVRRQVDMAVEENSVEVVDDFLHSLSRCNGSSLRDSESNHLRLAISEVSMDIVDAFSRLCSFSQHFCSSLFKVFFIASLQRLANKDGLSMLAYQLKSFEKQASFGGFKTLSLPRVVLKVFNEPVVFLVNVVHCGIFP